MPRLIAIGFIMLAAALPAVVRAASPDGAGTKTIVSKPMGLQFEVPADWKPNEVEFPALDKKTSKSWRLGFEQLDNEDGQPVFTLIRYDQKLSPDEAAKRVDAEIKSQRDSHKATDAKTLQDRKLTVAGSSGRIIEGQATIGDKSFCAMVVAWTLDGYEYRLIFNGRKDGYDKLKPIVDRMLATMKPA